MILPIGTRVKRGPSWMWGLQDSNGFGTVEEHIYDPWMTDQGFTLKVRWDKGNMNNYRYTTFYKDVIPLVITKTFEDFL
jgi:Mib_herc2